MSCYRASKFAKQDKDKIDAIKKELDDKNLDSGAKLSAARRGLDIARQHAKEKLAALQDEKMAKTKQKESAREKIRSKDIDAVKAQIKHLEGKSDLLNDLKGAHDDSIRENAIQRKINSVQNEINGVEKKAKAAKQERPETEKMMQLKEQLAQLQGTLKASPEKVRKLQETAIKAHLVRLDRVSADLKQRVANRDFTKKVNTREKVLTPEVQEKIREVNKLKAQWKRGLEAMEYKNMTKVQKALSLANDFKRFAIISGIKSVFKLGAASSEIAFVRPMTEIAGRGLRKIPFIDQIAGKASVEGGVGASTASDLAVYWNGIYKGAKEFPAIFTGKGSSLDIKFDKGSDIPPNWLGIPARLHEAIKNPTRLANYNFAVDRYLKWAEAQPDINPRDPAVINQAELEAFKYANRSIFKEDNFLVSKYQKLIQDLKQKGGGASALAFGLEQTLPIVRIPSNIVSQTFEYAFGSISGSKKVWNAYRDGIENLSSQEADVIMRQLKNGSVGGIMLAVGALCETSIGGIYMKGEEKDDEMEYGSAFGVPRYLLENPAFACLQIGATMSRYWKNHMPDAETIGEQGFTAATMLTLTSLGVLEETPFVKAMFSTPKIGESGERLPITLTEIYARPYIPAIFQHFANMSDLAEPVDWNDWKTILHAAIAPVPTPRAPENSSQAMLLAVPFLTESIPSRKDITEK